MLFAETLLARLNETTTPAALRALPGGISIPCANGGNVTVRMPRGIARVLNIEWTNCQIRALDDSTIATGPGQIVLINDNFTSTHVAAITLGSATRNVVMPFGYENGEGTFARVLTRNVRMIGVIPVTSAVGAEGTIQALYAVNGLRDETNDYTYLDPNRPPDHLAFHTEVRNGLVGNTQAWANGGSYFDTEARFIAGDYSSTITQPYYGTQTQKWSVENLRTRRIIDYANWVGNYSYDGGFTWTWSPHGTPRLFLAEGGKQKRSRPRRI